MGDPNYKLEVLRDKRKRNKRIREAVFEHGNTQRKIADHLRIHFASVSRILRRGDETGGARVRSIILDSLYRSFRILLTYVK